MVKNTELDSSMQTVQLVSAMILGAFGIMIRRIGAQIGRYRREKDIISRRPGLRDSQGEQAFWLLLHSHSG